MSFSQQAKLFDFWVENGESVDKRTGLPAPGLTSSGHNSEDASTTAPVSTKKLQNAKRRNFFLTQYQTNGCFESRFQRRLERKLHLFYQQIATYEVPVKFDKRFWHFTTNLRYSPGSQFIADAKFDQQGELLAAATNQGFLVLHHLPQVLYEVESQRGYLCPPEPVALGIPVATIALGQRSLENILWSPIDQHELLCSSGASPNIFLYNLSTCSSVPTCTFLGRRGGMDCCTSLSILPGRNAIVAGGTNGSLTFWDYRSPFKPSFYIPGVRGLGSLNSVEASTDAQLLFVGTRHGYLNIWGKQMPSL